MLNLAIDQKCSIKKQHRELIYSRVLFLICPSGSYCREDRCQSFFRFELVPSMRAPLEECEAASGVSKAGGEHIIIDAPAMGLEADAVISRAIEFDPDLIILAVTFGSLEADLEWANMLRQKFSQIPIGIRGAPAYVWADRILDQDSPVDFCLQGDYEVAVEEVVRYGLREARGVVWRSQDRKLIQNPPAHVELLDDLPLSERSSLNPMLYRVRGLGAPQATIHVQRGCPFPCTYCLVHTVSGNKARHRSAQSICREIKILKQQGIRFFYFRAETFSLNRKWALEVAQALKNSCPGIHWVSTTRVECVDDELLGALKESGCYGLSFGIDVASKVVAAKVRKPLLPDKAQQAMRLCDKHSIISLGYFMIGFPWETEETLAETKSFIQKVRPDLVTIHYAHPYPGTAYYEEVAQLNLNHTSLRAQSEPAFVPAALEPGELEHFGQKALIAHYTRPQVALSLMRKLGAIIYKRWNS